MNGLIMIRDGRRGERGVPSRTVKREPSAEAMSHFLNRSGSGALRVGVLPCCGPVCCEPVPCRDVLVALRVLRDLALERCPASWVNDVSLDALARKLRELQCARGRRAAEVRLQKLALMACPGVTPAIIIMLNAVLPTLCILRS